jgi:hypothetical protein
MDRRNGLIPLMVEAMAEFEGSKKLATHSGLLFRGQLLNYQSLQEHVELVVVQPDCLPNVPGRELLAMTIFPGPCLRTIDVYNGGTLFAFCLPYPGAHLKSSSCKCI